MITKASVCSTESPQFVSFGAVGPFRLFGFVTNPARVAEQNVYVKVGDMECIRLGTSHVFDARGQTDGEPIGEVKDGKTPCFYWYGELSVTTIPPPPKPLGGGSER